MTGSTKLLTLFFLVVPVPNLSPPADAQQSEADSKPTKLYSLVLVPSDLQEAKVAMTVFDRDEDGAIDQQEQQRLPWKKEVAEFDLNRDGKLTHLEVAVREAKVRDDADITEVDVKNVNVYMTRNDTNRNGQLDPDEIAAGWPSNPQDYDRNGDAILTAKELQITFAFNRGLRREMGIESIDQTTAIRIVRRYDKNKDKMLDAEERADTPLPKSAEAFDENGDGMLGIMELATMNAKHRRDTGLTAPDQLKIRRLFEQLDFDGDGRISKEESDSPLGQTIQGQLESFDANQDGTVTVQEVEKVVAAERKEKGYVEVDFQQAVRMLKRHDLNRSNSIEEDELFDKPAVGQLSKSILGKADLDKDKKINLEELAKHYAKERLSQTKP